MPDMPLTQDDAREQLRKAAAAYVELYGTPHGLYELGEDLCRIVAPEHGGRGAWTELVRHLMKISG